MRKHKSDDHDTEDRMFFGPCQCFKAKPSMRCSCGRFLCRQCARALHLTPATEWFEECVDNSLFVSKVMALAKGDTNA